MLKKLLLSISITATLFTSTAIAAIDDSEFSDNFDGVTAINNEELDEMRGTFLTSAGFEINFGFLTKTFLNGDAVSELSFDTATGASSSELQSVIQNGPGNSFTISPDFALANNSVLNVVQNSLDNQLIQTMNVLDISVSNFSQYRIQQFHDSLNANGLSGLR